MISKADTIFFSNQYEPVIIIIFIGAANFWNAPDQSTTLA